VAVHIFMKGERMSRRRAMKVLSATHAPLDGLSDCSGFWSMGWQPKWQTARIQNIINDGQCDFLQVTCQSRII